MDNLQRILEKRRQTESDPSVNMTENSTMLDEDLALQYSEEMMPEYERLDATLKSWEDAEVRTEQFPVTVARSAGVYDAPKEEQLSNKARKKKKSGLASKRKKAKTTYPYATGHTLDIVKSDERRLSASVLYTETYEEVFSQLKLNTVPEGPSVADIQRTFDSVMGFGPKLKFDKKGRPTRESIDEVKQFASDMVMNRSDVLSNIAAHMEREEVNPVKFTPRYVGEHYEEVRSQIERMKSYVQIFKEGTPEYEALSVEQKAQVVTMREKYRLAEAAFEEALKAHGLAYRGFGVSVASPKSANPSESKAAIEALKSYLSKERMQRDEAIDKMLDKQIERNRQASDSDTDAVVRKESRRRAKLYASKYETKRAIFTTIMEDLHGAYLSDVLEDVRVQKMMTLVREGDENREYNEKVVELAYDIVYNEGNSSIRYRAESLATELMKSVDALDTMKAKTTDEDELVSQLDKLVDVEMSLKAIDVLGSLKSASQLHLTIKEVYFGKPDATKMKPEDYEAAMRRYEARREIFEAKCTVAHATMGKARSVAIKQYSKYGIPDPGLLTDAEYARLKGQNGNEGRNILRYADFMHKKATMMVEASENKLFKSACMPEYCGKNLEKTIKPAAHKDFLKAWDIIHEVDAESERRSAQDSEHPISSRRILKERYEACLLRIEKVKSQLGVGNLDAEEKTKLETEMADIVGQIHLIEQIEALKERNYYLAGTDRHINMGEALFRSWRTSEQYDSIRAMSDEEHTLMINKLSAGAFLRQDSDPKEIAIAQNQNREGIRMLCDRLKLHYDYLEKKYGYDLPNVEYVLEHYDEMYQDFANVQVDNSLVVKGCDIFGVLDMSNQKDYRLVQQVRYYNTFGVMIAQLRGDIMLKNSLKMHRTTCSVIMGPLAETRKYLESTRESK